VNVLITGDRGFWTEKLVAFAIHKSAFHISRLISGLGPGIEWGALRWAINRGIRTMGFDKGPYLQKPNPEMARVEDMVAHAQAVILVTSRPSPKVKRVEALAKKAGLPIFHLEFKKEEW
jgi:hypothetical protein